MLATYVWIAFGSALGGVARFWCSSLVAGSVGGTFPWGTLLVNVVGSFIIGLFAVLTGPDGRIMAHPDARVFVTIGLCGGYTTFSSFSLQTLTLARDGDFLRAGANVVLSVVLCLAFVWIGAAVATAYNQLRGS